MRRQEIRKLEKEALSPTSRLTELVKEHNHNHNHNQGTQKQKPQTTNMRVRRRYHFVLSHF